MRIQGNTFLVAGGSSGLGAACVDMLCEHDARVVIADIDREAGMGLVEKLGTPVRFVSVDVTHPEQVATAIHVAQNELGGLHGAINCAGILHAARIVGRDGPYELEAFRRVIDVNLVGSFNVLRLVADYLSGNEPNDGGERGVIINTASVAAWEGQVGQASYAASKGGVAALTLPAARELSRFGIRVVAIAPGVFATPMMEGLDDKRRAALESQVPFPQRMGKPAEYAQLARQIFENSMLNGTVIRLDGALRMGG